MMKNIFKILTLLITIASPALVTADEVSEVTTLETVVVKGEKDEKYQTGDVDIKNTPISVTVIEREDFEGKIADLSELIEKETGVQVRQLGGLGSYSTVSLRGSTSDQVMVFIDGILLNDSSGGAVDLSTIPLSDVEAIEIYKGATPGNFGNSSIGGAINIRTLRSEKDLAASASVGYGSFNTRQAKGYLNSKPGKFDFLISFDAIESDNDFEFLNDNGTQYNKEDDMVEKSNNAQFDQYNAMARMGYDFSKNRRLDFMSQFFSKDQGLSSWNNDPETTASLETERSINSLTYNHDKVGGSFVNTKTSMDYSKKVELYDDSHGSIGLGNQKTRYVTSRYGGDIYVEWLGSIQTLSLLMDIHREDYEVEDQLGEDGFSDSNRNSYSSTIQDSLFLFEDSLVLTPALRYSHIASDLGTSVDIFGDLTEGTGQSRDYWSPQIGVKYNPFDWLLFKSNLGRYFRVPHFYELSGDRGYLIGNPDLLPEEGVNFDFGSEISSTTNLSWLDRWTLSGTYFRSDVDNLISIVYDARGIGQAVNIPGAKIQGIEAGVKLNFLQYFKIITNATLQDTENQDENDAFNGKELPGRWGQSYLGRIEAEYNRFNIFTEYLFNTDLYYDTANLLKAREKQEFNAGISFWIDPFLLSFDVKNIQDNQNEDFNGYPLPGRSFYAMLTYKY